jgi:endonuclease
MRYFAVTSENGIAQLHPFKPWFRATQNVPESSQWTTHQMRNHMLRHGWQLKESSDQVLIVKPGDEDAAELVIAQEEPSEELQNSNSAESSLFAFESHLRDYLSKNLNSTIKFSTPLTVIDKEYHTEVGFIDLLAKSPKGDLYVFELKVDHGADKALGQLLRYMGWCKKHLSEGRTVFGIILAAAISDKLRYAASLVPNVTLLEYELQIKVNSVEAL